MISVEELYKLAKSKNIVVYNDLPEELGYGVSFRFLDSSYAIALRDPSAYTVDTITLKEVLAHELGHCMTDGFPTADMTNEQKTLVEIKATLWAISKIMPLSEVIYAVNNGHNTPSKLSEFFGMSLSMVRIALLWYEEKLPIAFEPIKVKPITNEIKDTNYQLWCEKVEEYFNSALIKEMIYADV